MNKQNRTETTHRHTRQTGGCWIKRGSGEKRKK